MSLSGVTFAAGPYTITYNSVAMGIFVGDQQSPQIELFPYALPINNSDIYGRTTIGAIDLGGDAFWAAVAMEAERAAIQAALWPFGTLGLVPPVGPDLYDAAQALVMTVVAGTLAAAAGPQTVTASKAVLAPNFNTRILYGPVLREVPLRLQLLPYVSTGFRHFSKT